MYDGFHGFMIDIDFKNSFFTKKTLWVIYEIDASTGQNKFYRKVKQWINSVQLLYSNGETYRIPIFFCSEEAGLELYSICGI